MKRLAALLIVLCMLLSAAGATAGNEQVQGEIVIYSSMYQFVLDMLDEALREEFPNLKPGNNGSFFVYGGTSRLINQIYGEMEDGVLGCDMLLVAEPALSLELKDAEYLEPVEVPDAASLLRFPYDEDGYWYPVRVCNMVLAYNPELEARWAEKSVTVPKTFKDFASDRSLKGVIAMGDPLSSGTTFAAVASLTQSDEDAVLALADDCMRKFQAGQLDEALDMIHVLYNNVVYKKSDSYTAQLKQRFEAYPVLSFERLYHSFSTEGNNDISYSYVFEPANGNIPASTRKLMFNPVYIDGQWYLTFKDGSQSSRDLPVDKQVHELAPAPTAPRLNTRPQ